VVRARLTRFALTAATERQTRHGPVSKPTSSTLKLPSVPVVAPICTEPAWVVKLCVPRMPRRDSRRPWPNPSRLPLLPVPRFWWIPMRRRFQESAPQWLSLGWRHHFAGSASLSSPKLTPRFRHQCAHHPDLGKERIAASLLCPHDYGKHFVRILTMNRCRTLYNRPSEERRLGPVLPRTFFAFLIRSKYKSLL